MIEIVIGTTPLPANITDFVTSCVVDQALDKASMITLTIANPFFDQRKTPRSSKLSFTDALAFQPGNVVEVYMGFTRPLPIAAGVIKKWQPVFPRESMPTITLKCYDGLAEMMDGNDDVNATKARKFERDTTLIDIALDIFNEYGFDVETDVALNPPTLSVPAQKKIGMSDYAFIRGIANTLGWDFYTTWDFSARNWIVHFKPAVADDSEKQVFTWGPDFEMNGGAGGLLLDFAPEFVTQGQSTDVEVFYFDRGSKTWEKITYPEERSQKKKEFEWKGDDTTIEADLQAVGDFESGRGLRIQAGGASIEVVPTFGFQTSEEAVQFARNWWRARQDMLIAGQGATIGYPQMRPGQVHTLEGLGGGLSGDWYIAETQHRYTAGNGYETGFLARKVIP